jgi:hypothetical protein
MTYDKIGTLFRHRPVIDPRTGEQKKEPNYFIEKEDLVGILMEAVKIYGTDNLSLRVNPHFWRLQLLSWGVNNISTEMFCHLLHGFSTCADPVENVPKKFLGHDLTFSYALRENILIVESEQKEVFRITCEELPGPIGAEIRT